MKDDIFLAVSSITIAANVNITSAIKIIQEICRKKNIDEPNVVGILIAAKDILNLVHEDILTFAKTNSTPI